MRGLKRADAEDSLPIAKRLRSASVSGTSATDANDGDVATDAVPPTSIEGAKLGKSAAAQTNAPTVTTLASFALQTLPQTRPPYAPLAGSPTSLERARVSPVLDVMVELAGDSKVDRYEQSRAEQSRAELRVAATILLSLDTRES